MYCTSICTYVRTCSKWGVPTSVCVLHIRTYVRNCMCALYIRTYVYVCMHCIYVRMYVRMYVRICMHSMYIGTYVYIYVPMYALYVHTYIYGYVHTLRFVGTYVCTIGLEADCSFPADSSPHCLPLPLLPALPFQTYQVQLSPPCLNLLGLLQPSVTIERAVQVRTRACMHDTLLTHWPWIRVTQMLCM